MRKIKEYEKRCQLKTLHECGWNLICTSVVIVCVCVCERFLNDHSPLFEKMLTQQKRESIETWLWNRKNWERFRLCGPLGRLNGSWSFFSRMYLKCINCCLVPIVNGWSLFSLRFFSSCVCRFVTRFSNAFQLMFDSNRRRTLNKNGRKTEMASMTTAMLMRSNRE